MNRRTFLAAGAVSAIGCTALRRGTGARETVERRSRLPNVPLRTHEGKTVRFYDDLIRGRIVTVNFMYARCQNICPGMTSNLSMVQRALGDRVGRDIFMYSITLKPEEDTPAVLSSYAATHGVKPGWLFLTGQHDDIETLRRRLGFVDPDPAVDADTSQHIGVVLYGNDALDRWAACPALTDPEEMAKYVLWMEGRRRPG
ncbi:MAG: SCO family protein [Deltaproteobacteria bacterium]|nr:MAG: SCO family protein [Deltaproteobacteria bacterium]